MKYLFINAFSGFGSTGKIVERQCRELMAQGHECAIAYGRSEARAPGIPDYKITSPMGNRIHGIESRLFDNHAFASRIATARFLKWVRLYDPDVIWIHNLHGYYIHAGMLFSYLKNCGKEIRWTLHDCWAFTGHCSHFENAECDRWKFGCYNCPLKKEYPSSILLDASKQNYLKKKKAFTGVPNLTIITPSHWLENLVYSSFLSEYPVQVVHNTIDPTVFCPTESDFREKNNLQDKNVILGVSNMWDDTKGLQYFKMLAERLDDHYKVVLVGIPQEIKQTLPDSILAIPRTTDRKELAGIYSSADVFVNPTLEDTYPTVNLEASACGCRIVSFDTGGCPETVKPEDILVHRGDGEMLLQQVITVCGLKNNRK